MASLIPNEWRYVPPESLVVGRGPYAVALATILGTEAIAFGQLNAGPEANDVGAYPQVLESLARVILVVSESMSAAEVIQSHRAIWHWVGKLSSAGDQHELAFLFILPANASQESEDALAVSLGVSQINPASTGHAVWRSSGSFSEMLEVLTSIRPMDLLPVRARLATDTKHTAMAGLRSTLERDNPTAVSESARQVLAAFSGREYLLDLFCRPPSHRHGNLLRSWLNAALTNPVPQDGWNVGRQQIAEWLARDEHDRTI